MTQAILRGLIRRAAILLSVVTTVGCGYDAAGPQVYGDPPPPPPTPAVTPNDGLWLINGSRDFATLLRLSPAQLLTGGSLVAATEINTASASLAEINSIAFDTTGTMWIASSTDSLLLAYLPEVLNVSGLHPARRVILPVNRSLSAPSGLAFDRKQRLWVANSAAGTLVRFDPQQLGATGRPVPAVVIDGPVHPVGLAFDARGGLWVASSEANTLSRYSPAQLEGSGRLVPDVILRANAGSLGSPFAIAFDAAGDLWVSNIGSGTLVRFGAAQLVATGAPEPQTSITLEPSLGIASTLAFDGEGNLWVLGAGVGLGKFNPAELRAGGRLAPVVTAQVQGHSPLAGLAFFPRQRGLPIN